jgi:hypothetical protein
MAIFKNDFSGGIRFSGYASTRSEFPSPTVVYQNLIGVAHAPIFSPSSFLRRLPHRITRLEKIKK